VENEVKDLQNQLKNAEAGTNASVANLTNNLNAK
jgi:hypothetical protein